MSLRRVEEVNDVLSVGIDVRPVIVVLLDRLLGRDELADVDGGRVSEVLEVVGQLLQLIVQVLGLANRVLVEVLNPLVFLGLGFELRLLLLLLQAHLVGMLVLQLLYLNFLLLLLRNGILLNIRIV